MCGFAADILRKEKECFEQNKAYFCRFSAKTGILCTENDIISAYDTAIALLEGRKYDKTIGGNREGVQGSAGTDA